MMRLLISALAAGLVCLTLALTASDAAAPRFVGWPSWGNATWVTFGQDGRRGGMYRVNPNGGPPIRLTALGNGDGPSSVSPDGKTLAFGSGSSLYRMNVAGGALEKLGAGFNPVWSPHGHSLAYVGAGGGVWVMKADGTGKHKIVTDQYPESTGAPVWSPNGSKLAYVKCSAPYLSDSCEHQYGFDVYTIRLNGTGKHKVTPKSGLPQCLTWSSKGALAFLTSDDTAAIVQKNGTLKTYSPGGCPAWAPSGKRLAVPTATGIFLMSSDGGHRKRITILPGSYAGFSRPAWSGDGTRLAVIGGNSSQHLWVVRANGTGLKKLF